MTFQLWKVQMGVCSHTEYKCSTMCIQLVNSISLFFVCIICHGTVTKLIRILKSEAEILEVHFHRNMLKYCVAIAVWEGLWSNLWYKYCVCCPFWHSPYTIFKLNAKFTTRCMQGLSDAVFNLSFTFLCELEWLCLNVYHCMVWTWYLSIHCACLSYIMLNLITKCTRNMFIVTIIIRRNVI